MIRMKWGMICSVENGEELMPTLKEFGKWLVEAISTHGRKIDLFRGFEPMASFIFLCPPQDVQKVNESYSTVGLEFPDVLFVVHILPVQDSVEFRLMKELTLKYGLVGQGVLLENALSRFAGCGEIASIMNGINQWVLRRLSNIVSRHKENNFRLTVNGPDPSKLRFHGNYSDPYYDVDSILHSEIRIKEFSEVENMLIVSGFPSKFNKFQVASLFPTFRPVHVLRARSNQAIVEFSNKYQAAQTLSIYNNLNFSDEGFTLQVSPVSEGPSKRIERIREKLSIAKLTSEK